MASLFCYTIKRIIVSFIFTVIMYWILLGEGIVTMYIFNGNYEFRTGNCTNGLFCDKNSLSMCSLERNAKLYLGCPLAGFTGTFCIITLLIIMLLIIMTGSCVYSFLRKFVNKYRQAEIYSINIP